MTNESKPVLWRNVFGEPVDLDKIDREYALNIYHMRVARKASVLGWTAQDFEDDPLTQKLREIILSRRRKRPRDYARAIHYNIRCKCAGLKFRAKVL